jgi:hypothetical protein
MKLLISLFGMSQTGKTKSALRLMAGIEPDPKKRGLLDTEGGERGRMYEDEIPGGYMYGSLTPPFTPERYAEALLDFVAGGVTTLTVDSVSHAWFASGGILDMVEQATEKNDLAKWAKPKRRLGKLTNQWLSCGLHLILCSRGKQPLIEVIGDNNRKTYVPGPVIPIQEKSLKFDMTVMAKMLGDGRFTVAFDEGGKCPGALRPIFEGHEVMDEEMGRKLIAWIGGADLVSPEMLKLSLLAAERASEGVEAYKAFWTALTKPQRVHLEPKHENLKSVARATDADAARAKEEAAEVATEPDLTDPFDTNKPALKSGVEQAGGRIGFGDPDQQDDLDATNTQSMLDRVNEAAPNVKTLTDMAAKSNAAWLAEWKLLSVSGQQRVDARISERLAELRVGG